MTTEAPSRARLTALGLAGALLLLGCGGEGTPAPGEEQSGAELPELSPPSQTVEPSRPEPQTVLDIFPEDPARTLVMNNCASCHAVACAAMGQRTAARWNALQESHVEQVPALAAESLDSIFEYLETNFNDTQPEPMIPSAFLEGGCTPF